MFLYIITYRETLSHLKQTGIRGQSTDQVDSVIFDSEVIDRADVSNYSLTAGAPLMTAVTVSGLIDCHYFPTDPHDNPIQW